MKRFAWSHGPHLDFNKPIEHIAAGIWSSSFDGLP